jgi:molybdopterin converting factor small subunit
MGEVHVRIPGPLRPFTDGAEELCAAAGTVATVIDAMGARHPQLLPRLLTPEGELRPYVNVFVGRDNVRDLQGLATVVADGAVIRILPAFAGG